MKHIIVTGGAGFIGSHLCESLLNRGYAVTAIDNFVTGRKSNLDSFSNHPHFQLLAHDICEPIQPKQIPFLENFDLAGIFHFACPASPVDFDKIPLEILAVDSVGTMNTVKLALEWKCRYVLASTSEIYGDPLVHPQTEEYWGNVNTIGPRACYDETKRFAEAYVSSATRKYGLNAGIVRIFNTYGPRMRIDDGRIVPELCRQILTSEPMTVHGNGVQTRSFCFVSDLVEGILKVFDSPIQTPINLGNPEEYSVLDFANLLGKISGKTAKIHFLPGRVDDPKRRCPDISKAKSLLNWSPKVPLETGLKECLTYFRTLL